MIDDTAEAGYAKSLICTAVLATTKIMANYNTSIASAGTPLDTAQ